MFTTSFEDPHRNDPGARRRTEDLYAAVYVLELSSGDYKRITKTGETDIAAMPSWSPDGTKVLFTCFVPPRGSREVCIIDADGAHQQQLTARNGSFRQRRWNQSTPDP